MSITPEAYQNEVMERRDETRPLIGLNPHVGVSVHADVPPKAVWEVVSDVTRSGEWSGEPHGCV